MGNASTHAWYRRNVSGNVCRSRDSWTTWPRDKRTTFACTISLQRPVPRPTRDDFFDCSHTIPQACGAGANQVRAFLVETGSPIGEVQGHSKQINSLDYRKTRPYRVVAGGEDFAVTFHQGPPFKFDKSHTDKHKGFVEGVRFAPDGSKFVSCGADGKIFV